MAARGRRRSTAAGRCFGGESSQAWQGQTHRVTAANCNYYARKLHGQFTGTWRTLMGRMPAWLHEVLPCFPRRWVETYGGLTSSSQSARGRPCVRSSRSACATGTAASWLHAHASPDRLERISRKRAPPECFCFEKRLFGSWKKENVSVKNDAGRSSAQHIHCAKRGPKAGSSLLVEPISQRL